MKSGTMYEQGEIIIVPFPFSDLSGMKQRPVLVLSKSTDNKKADDIITCGITSNLKNARYSVLIDNNDLETGAIPIKSRIKVDKLFTLDKSIVIKKVGKLGRKKLEEVRKEFMGLV